MTLLFVFLLIPTIFVSIIFSILIAQKTKQEMVQKVPSMIEGLKIGVETVLDTTEHIPVMLDNHPDVKLSVTKMLEQTSVSYVEMYGFRILNSLLDIPPNVNFFIDSVYVYMDNNNKNFIVSGLGVRGIEDYPDHQWYDQYLSLKDNKKLFIEEREIKKYRFEQTLTRVISLYKPVSGGVVVTNIDANYLNNLLNHNKTFDDEIILVARPLDENILFTNKQVNPDLLKQVLNAGDVKSGTIIFHDSPYLIHSYYSNQYDLFFLSIIPESNVLSLVLEEITIIVLCTVLISFLLALIIAYFQVQRDFRELYNIIDLFNGEDKEMVHERMVHDERNEYNFIQNKIVQTFISQSYLKMQLSERIYKQKIAELTALQLQINPHFLFNTLQTIGFEIGMHIENKQQIHDIIHNLSLLLKYSFQDEETMVTLEQEVHHAQLYCTIQKFRFGDRFEIIWEYSPEYLSLSFSRMVLQPLIENSLIHGIMPKQSSGLIKVKIFELRGRLVIRVIDNGVGIKQEKLLDIQNDLKRKDRMFDGKSIGLINTSYRLKLKYGEESRIMIKSKEGFGTIVHFSVPL